MGECAYVAGPENSGAGAVDDGSMYTEDAAESEETRADVAEDEGGEFDLFKGDPKVMFVCAAPDTGRAGRMERVDKERVAAAGTPPAEWLD